MLTDSYIDYISKVRRYSGRTCRIYADALAEFCRFCMRDAGGGAPGEAPGGGILSDGELLENLIPSRLREYEVWLMDGRDGAGRLDARTVNLHLSVLSGFCRFLLREGHLQANPVRTVRRPKAEKRLPVFYRDASMEHYFARTAHSASEDELAVLESFGPFVGNRSESARTPVEMYERRLRRLIISLLHATGIRRSELIGLNLDSLDAGRQTLRVRGKGDKMREIPLISSVWQEILLYFSVYIFFLFLLFLGSGAAAPVPDVAPDVISELTSSFASAEVRRPLAICVTNTSSIWKIYFGTK